MKKLKITLQKEWFKRHQEDKNEEYRAITPYWCSRLLRIDGRKLTKDETDRFCKMSKDEKTGTVLSEIAFAESIQFVKYDILHAFNGAYYSEALPNFKKPILSIEVGHGRKEWGASEKLVFIIKVGAILDKSFNGLRAKYKMLKDEYQNGDVTPERQEEIHKELEALNSELIKLGNSINKKYGISRF